MFSQVPLVFERLIFQFFQMDETHRRNQHEKPTKNVFNLLPSEFERLRSAQQNDFFSPQVKNFVVRLKKVALDVYKCVFLSSCISEFSFDGVAEVSFLKNTCVRALAAHAQNRPGAETVAARCALTAAISGLRDAICQHGPRNENPFASQLFSSIALIAHKTCTNNQIKTTLISRKLEKGTKTG